MEITFILGNGFDIAAGLPTSYEDFYKYLETDTSNAPGELIIRNSIRKRQEFSGELWKDFELGLGKFTSAFTKDNFLKLLQANNIPQVGLDPLQTFNKGYQYAQKMLRRYLQGIEDKRVAYMKLSPAGRVAFSRWIRCPFKDLIGQQRHDVDHMCRQHHNEEWEVHFLTFNYTTLLDECISVLWGRRADLYKSREGHHTGICKIDRDMPVLHIHHKLPDSVMGVGNLEQIAHKAFKKQLKQEIVKPEIDRSLQKCYAQAESRISSSQIICIFGTSLGETDIHWCTKIGEWLLEKIDHHLIIYEYTTKDYHVGGIASRIANDRLTDFCTKSGISRKLIENRFHVVPFNRGEIVNPSWFALFRS